MKLRLLAILSLLIIYFPNAHAQRFDHKVVFGNEIRVGFPGEPEIEAINNQNVASIDDGAVSYFLISIEQELPLTGTEAYNKFYAGVLDGMITSDYIKVDSLYPTTFQGIPAWRVISHLSFEQEAQQGTMYQEQLLLATRDHFYNFQVVTDNRPNLDKLKVHEQYFASIEVLIDSPFNTDHNGQSEMGKAYAENQHDDNTTNLAFQIGQLTGRLIIPVLFVLLVLFVIWLMKRRKNKH